MTKSIGSRLLDAAGIILLICGVIGMTNWVLQPVTHAASGRPCHVTGQGIPGSLTYPGCLEGGTTQKDLDVLVLTIANTDSSAHTITVQDGQGTPFILFNAAPIAAKTTWTVYLGGTRFRGGVQWTSDTTLVQGALIASY